MGKPRGIRFTDEEEIIIKRFLRLNPSVSFSTVARIAILAFMENPDLKLHPSKKTATGKRKMLTGEQAINRTSTSLLRETPVSNKIEMLGKRLDKLSSYRSNFDFNVYRKIERRFAADLRGGIICKTDLKLANFHPSCSKCHYSLELDTYGRGCLHECSYCYAKDELSLHGYWNNPMPFPINISEVRKIFYTVFETDKATKWRDILVKRIPLRLGSMSDSFMAMDKVYGITKELLKILKHYRYPTIIFTRSNLVADYSYLSLLDAELNSVQFSISGMDENLTKLIEPGAPSVAKRLQALAALGDAGIRTAVRLNPLFPTFPDGYFSDPVGVLNRFGTANKIPRFPLFDIERLEEFLELLVAAKVKTLLAGFVRLKSSTLNQIERSSGIDLRPFFLPEVINSGLGGNREKKFSDAEIREYYLRIAAACETKPIRFSTCYIGNGTKDYYQYQWLWANKSDCCDVRGHVSSFKNSSQDIAWSTREKHTSKKELAFLAQQNERKLDQLWLHRMGEVLSESTHA